MLLESISAPALDVSVIIPTFRRPEPLRMAVESVLRQRGVNVEVIVVDDSPEGGAAAVIEAINDSRVRYLRNPLPSGGRPGAVRNLGWPLARAPLLHFLDDDDLVPEDHYIAARAAFDRNPGVGAVFGRIEPFGADAGAVAEEKEYFAQTMQNAMRSGRFGTRLGYSAHLFFDRTFLVCGAGMVRRSALAQVQGFDPELRLMEDVDLYARIIRRFGAYYMDRVSLHYRIGPSLIHRSGVQPGIDESYRRIHAKYRNEWGRLQFFALKLFARTLLRMA